MRRRRRTQQSFLIAEEPLGEELERALGQGLPMGREVDPPGDGEPVDVAAEPPVEPTHPEPAAVEEWEPVLDPDEEAPQPAEDEPELPPAATSRLRNSRERLNRSARPCGHRAARRPARLAAVAAVCFAGGLGLTLAVRSGSHESPAREAAPSVAESPGRREIARADPRPDHSKPRTRRRARRRERSTHERRSARRGESRQRARRGRDNRSSTRPRAVMASAPSSSTGGASIRDSSSRSNVPDVPPEPRAPAPAPAAPSSGSGQPSASGGGSSSSSSSARRSTPSSGGEFSFER